MLESATYRHKKIIQTYNIYRNLIFMLINVCVASNDYVILSFSVHTTYAYLEFKSDTDLYKHPSTLTTISQRPQSIGQDTRLSPRRPGFDSRRGRISSKFVKFFIKSKEDTCQRPSYVWEQHGMYFPCPRARKVLSVPQGAENTFRGAVYVLVLSTQRQKNNARPGPDMKPGEMEKPH